MKKNTSGRSRAYLHIRNVILTDPNAVGTFLNEREIAETLGISRTPVREAFMLLASEDLVDLKPNRGAFVAPMNLQQINNVFQARGVIETWSAQYCITNQIDPTPTMIEKLNMQKLQKEDAPFIEFIELDRSFHCALIQATNNEALNQMYELLHARHLTFGVRAIQRTNERRKQVLEEHQKIVDALIEKDIEACQNAILTHLEMTRENLN